MNAFLAAGTGLSDFACSAEKCLSWIIILLNILTVFYLVFCAWFKVTKAVKIIGYVWASALTVGTIAVVAMHTCIFTILSAVFTALILMAVLSIVFNKGIFAKDKEEEQTIKALGAYVIHKTDDNKYVFLAYNNKKVAVGKSYYKYNSVDEAKKAVRTCRENALFVSVEDKTKNWIEYADHPKFVMYEDGGKFRFHMTLSDGTVVLTSESVDTNEQCRKIMQEAISAVKSEKLYYSEREVLSCGQFISFSVEEEEKPSPQNEANAETTDAEVKKDFPEVISEVAATNDSDSSTEDVAPDEDEETIIVVDEEGNKFRILRKKSFTAKLYQSPDETKRYYNELKNEVLSYERTRSRVSWFYDSVNAGRNPLIKFGIRGKTLCVYYPLNADDYAESKYKVEKAEAAKYESVPCMYRIKNDRRLKYAKDLIATVCEKMGLVQGDIPTNDYYHPNETTEYLIAKGLIKEVKVRSR